MKGLPSRFYLQNGKFKLVDGVEKSRDNIWFYCIFDKFRVYSSDFGADFVSLVQKPISSIVLNKTLILGKLKRGIQKYVPNVSVKAIDIGRLPNERRSYTMLIEYTSKQENNVETQDVTFV